MDCSRVLFRRELSNDMLYMATGETLAHLNCLIGRRMIRRERDAAGVDWYVQKPDALGPGVLTLPLATNLPNNGAPALPPITTGDFHDQRHHRRHQ